MYAQIIMMKHQIQNVYENVILHYLKPTPLKRSEWLSDHVNGNVFLKLECLNSIGSFKARGALNALTALRKEHQKNFPAKKMKVATASAGNHAQGLAFAAKHLDCEAHIFLPTTASSVKRIATEKLGGKIYLIGKNIEEALESARAFCEKEGAYLINPFNDANIILGQATCALETDLQLQGINMSPDYFICAIGGGGLAAGACMYFDPHKTKVIGVQQEQYNSALKSLQLHTVVPMDDASNPSTIADGIAVKMIGPLTFKYMYNIIKKVTLVSEHDIYRVIANIYRHENIIAEGAGAAAVAELFKNPDEYRNKTSVVCISGGNIDEAVFQKVLECTKETL